MRIRYVGSRPRDVSPSGSREFHVEPGDELDVADAVGRSLVEQPRFVEVKPKAPKKSIADDVEEND